MSVDAGAGVRATSSFDADTSLVVILVVVEEGGEPFEEIESVELGEAPTTSSTISRRTPSFRRFTVIELVLLHLSSFIFLFPSMMLFFSLS